MPTLANAEAQRQAVQRLARLHLSRRRGPATHALDAVPETSLYEFVTQRSWQIDRHPFDWDAHRYLIPIYQAFTLRPHEDRGLDLTIVKGAQIGATIFALSAVVFTAMKFWGCWVGYFLPDQGLMQITSANRFKPFVDSNPAVAKLLGDTGEGDGENSKRLRNLGPSSILFSYLGGTTSTESVPLTAIFFDEVRRMDAQGLGLARERISHSQYPIEIKLSTAGLPDQDIDYHYKLGNQQEWHTRCACPGHDGVLLADIWPECIGIEGDDVFYRCPKCALRIRNPQDGVYIAHAPGHDKPSWRIPQTLSLTPLHTPRALWQKFNDPLTDRGEFYRSTLGRPHIDSAAQLVTDEDLQACVNTSLRWEKEGVNCCMGIDQKGGCNDIVVMRRATSGKFQLLHLERIEHASPFHSGRLDALMRSYDVSCCVCDLNPNTNDAREFAHRWASRVFLVTYSHTDRAEMIAWWDRQRKKTQFSNEPEVRLRHTVTLHYYKGLEWALTMFRDRQIEMPHPMELVQECHDDHGVKRQVLLCKELFWEHQKRIIRQKTVVPHGETGDTPHEKQEKSLEVKWTMGKVGADPHFAFAGWYCCTALARTYTGRVGSI